MKFIQYESTFLLCLSNEIIKSDLMYIFFVYDNYFDGAYQRFNRYLIYISNIEFGVHAFISICIHYIWKRLIIKFKISNTQRNNYFSDYLVSKNEIEIFYIVASLNFKCSHRAWCKWWIASWQIAKYVKTFAFLARWIFPWKSLQE